MLIRQLQDIGGSARPLADSASTAGQRHCGSCQCPAQAKAENAPFLTLTLALALTLTLAQPAPSRPRAANRR